MTVKFALFAGILIQDEMIELIDIDGGEQLSEAELGVWLDNTWAPAISISIDAQTNVPINSEVARVIAPAQPNLLFLSEPLLIEVDVPIPTDGLPHQLLIRNDYESHRSDYDLQVLTAPGTEARELSNNGRAMVVEFETDPEAEGGELSQASFSAVITSDDKSFMDKVMDQILWIGIGLLALAVVGWLGYLRHAEAKTVKAAEAAKAARSANRKPPRKKR